MTGCLAPPLLVEATITRPDVLRLYDFLPSGNGFKVRLLLHLLERPYELVELDILRGETRTPAFLAKNPNGRVPVLELPDGTCLAESNAIQCYLAEGTAYLPADPLDRARVLQWLFFEQYSHEPYVAVARFIHEFTGDDHSRRAELPRLMERGHAALAIMERHLGERTYFVGQSLTIADIALYAYTHVAHEGGFDLARYPAIQVWLARVAAEPRYVPITRR